jgi:hypothetical protein
MLEVAWSAAGVVVPALKVGQGVLSGRVWVSDLGGGLLLAQL